MNVNRCLLIAAVSGGLLAMTVPAQAQLTADVCRRIAETGAGVYDRSIKNGNSVADAERSAQNVVIRRVHEESGTKISTMEDAVNACNGAGVARVSMCAWVSRYYTGAPC